ncbi:RSP_7527 family protein [Tropicimonas isoalkanivorans]|uniref:Uncharacterized protein n=1 Tax=Tropicimonas isoalkanivorans TaxID=441112 RepID=A0A1I1JQ09_9RHOB|nr:hypothetical protein [Tropicimonas isoalkanivorans]SFC50485.1 hypothetical protein SAMN04488094_105213 [Tropicimonas isoalkanivorans]
MKDYPQQYIAGVHLQSADRIDIQQIEREAARLRAEFIADNARAAWRGLAGLFRSGKVGGKAQTAA